MAEDRPQSDELSGKQASQAPDSEEANWGEDWESAFEAEEDHFFSGEGEASDGFFLDEKSATTGIKEASDNLASSLAQSLDSIPDQQEPGGASTLVSLLKGTTSGGAAIAGSVASLWQRLQALPPWYRIPSYLLPFLLLGILALFMGQETTTPISPGENSAPAGEEGGELPAPTAELALPESAPEKIRKKWPFPSFLIAVPSENANQRMAFLMVDITLVAVLAPNEEPPAEKKNLVRDLIYQFYRNQSSEELRRFSLARGEMNRKLRAWLHKQWPDAPIESIIFDRYSIS